MIQRIINPTKAIRTVRKTTTLIHNAVANLSQSEAESLRDGPDGWSILFIVCHLRDYELSLAERIELVLNNDPATLFAWDQVALVEQNRYAEQDFASVYAELTKLRAAHLEQIDGFSDEQWLRMANHPVQGPGTLLDIILNTGIHDIDHLEQISRCAAL